MTKYPQIKKWRPKQIMKRLLEFYRNYCWIWNKNIGTNKHPLKLWQKLAVLWAFFSTVSCLKSQLLKSALNLLSFCIQKYFINSIVHTKRSIVIRLSTCPYLYFIFIHSRALIRIKTWAHNALYGKYSFRIKKCRSLCIRKVNKFTQCIILCIYLFRERLCARRNEGFSHFHFRVHEMKFCKIGSKRRNGPQLKFEIRRCGNWSALKIQIENAHAFCYVRIMFVWLVEREAAS